MTGTPDPLNLDQVTQRNQHAQAILAGFTRTTPALAKAWQQLRDALADTPRLTAEITRLASQARDTRLDRAALLAAISATLTACADGEPDPLWYLRDELSARHTRQETP